MPPQGRGRGGRAGWGAGRAGSAASADPGAGPSTSGRSGPASQLSLLPVPLLRAYRALPAAAEALLPAPVTQRPGGGSSAAGRGRGAGSGRLAALREAKEQLRELGFAVTDLSHLRQPEQAAALAELLSTHPAETAALLRLYSSALRPDGEERAGGESGSGSGSGGGGSPGEALALEGWRADVSSVVAFLIYRLRPLPANRHALSALRFLLALLRAQTLQAFSRRLASAAKAAASGGGGGSAFMKRMVGVLCSLDGHMPWKDTASRVLPAEVESLRAACVEEWARGLAESGLLEHAARRLLLLHARVAEGSGSAEELLELADAVSRAATTTTSPAAAAHFRSVLRGRCLQTAVLVYGVGTLRLLDGGPSYGLLPAALQTAGRPLRSVQGSQALSPTALHPLSQLLASRDALPPLGPGPSLELALRVGWAAVALPGSPPSLSALVPCVPPPPPLHAQLSMQPGEGARLAMAALHCGRHLLGRQREVSPPWLAAQRQEWWRLAACTVVHGIWAMDGDAQTWLWEVVTDRLTVMGPKASIVKPVKVQGCCRFDLDALPPAPPPEVAAALAAGLLPALAALPDLPRSGPANPRGPFAELLTACNRDRPDGSGLALFLAPLLAYGEPGQAEGLLGALGRAGGLVGPSGGGAGTDPFREAATSLLGALAGALQRCRGLGVAAAEAAEESLEAAAGPVEAAEGSRGGYGLEAKAGAVGSGGPSGAVPPPPPLQQLRRLLAIAAELWGLPLPAQPAAVVEKGDASA